MFRRAVTAVVECIHVSVECPGATNDLTPYSHSNLKSLVSLISKNMYIAGDNAYVASDNLLTPLAGRAKSMWEKARLTFISASFVFE